MEVLVKIVEVVQVWLPAITGVISACAVVATLTPTKTDDEILQKILDVINFLGMNIGKAENKDG